MTARSIVANKALAFLLTNGGRLWLGSSCSGSPRRRLLHLRPTTARIDVAAHGRPRGQRLRGGHPQSRSRLRARPGRPCSRRRSLYLRCAKTARAESSSDMPGRSSMSRCHSPMDSRPAQQALCLPGVGTHPPLSCRLDSRSAGSNDAQRCAQWSWQWSLSFICC